MIFNNNSTRGHTGSLLVCLICVGIENMEMHIHVANGQFHIGEHLMAKNNLQNSLKLLVLMYR